MTDGIKYNILKLISIFPIDINAFDVIENNKSNLTASIKNVANKYQTKTNDKKFSPL